MGLLISWCILTFAFVATSKLVDGFKLKGGLGNQFLVAGLFAILNVLLGRVFFIAIGIGTLGLGFLLSFLARLVATAIVLKITDALTSKLSVKSFGTAFVAALVISVIASLTEYVLGVLHVG